MRTKTLLASLLLASLVLPAHAELVYRKVDPAAPATRAEDGAQVDSIFDDIGDFFSKDVPSAANTVADGISTATEWAHKNVHSPNYWIKEGVKEGINAIEGRSAQDDNVPAATPGNAPASAPR
jgi:hypothetical protein